MAPTSIAVLDVTRGYLIEQAEEVYFDKAHCYDWKLTDMKRGWYLVFRRIGPQFSDDGLIWNAGTSATAAYKREMIQNYVNGEYLYLLHKQPSKNFEGE